MSIDTIQIKIPMYKVEVQFPERFNPHLDHFSQHHKRAVLQTNDEFYTPNVTVGKYYNHQIKANENAMFITLSVPKLMFGHNLYEVSHLDINSFVRKLVSTLLQYGIVVDKNDILEASVKEIHFGKNLILDGVKSKKIIQMLSKANVKRLGMQRSKYNGDGEQLEFKTKNTYIISFYDKTKELLSNYKSMRKDTFHKKQQFEAVDRSKDKEILRMEVKLLSSVKITSVLKSFNLHITPVLKNLFHEGLAKAVLLSYWDTVVESIKIHSEKQLNKVMNVIFDDKSLSTAVFGTTASAIYYIHTKGRKAMMAKSETITRKAEKYLEKISAESNASLDYVRSILEKFELITHIEEEFRMPSASCGHVRRKVYKVDYSLDTVERNIQLEKDKEARRQKLEMAKAERIQTKKAKYVDPELVQQLHDEEYIQKAKEVDSSDLVANDDGSVDYDFTHLLS